MFILQLIEASLGGGITPFSNLDYAFWQSFLTLQLIFYQTFFLRQGESYAEEGKNFIDIAKYLTIENPYKLFEVYLLEFSFKLPQIK